LPPRQPEPLDREEYIGLVLLIILVHPSPEPPVYEMTVPFLISIAAATLWFVTVRLHRRADG
jgi:hypothetical protein